jgi:hypothetical protein
MSTETKQPDNKSRGAGDPGYEKRDASIRGLLQFAFWLAMVLVVSFVGMKWTLDYFQRTEPLGPPASPIENARQLPPAPRLQAHPHQELVDFCTDQEQKLATYGWMDRQAGVVRIPVDRAMELVLERGLPIRPASQMPPDSAEAHQVGTVEAPLPQGVAGPCGYLYEQVQEAAKQANEKP